MNPIEAPTSPVRPISEYEKFLLHLTVRCHEAKPCMKEAVFTGLSEARRGFFRDAWALPNK